MPTGRTMFEAREHGAGAGLYGLDAGPAADRVGIDLLNIDTDRIIPARFFRKPRSAGVREA